MFSVAYMIIVIPVAFLMSILSFLIFPVIYAVLGFFLVIMFTALPAQIFGRNNIGSALTQSFKLLKGNWWSSLGLLILLMLIYNIVTIVFSIPFYVGIIVNMLAVIEVDPLVEVPTYLAMLNYVFGAILLIGTFISYTIPIVGMSLQYFNLSEIKEATSLIQRIDSFGESEPEEEENY
jgi:hypothetical protein